MSDEPSTLPERNQRVAATPQVRRIANRYGVELAAVQGSGAGGRIRPEDVVGRAEAMRPRPPASPPRGAVGRFGHPSATDVSALARTPSCLAKARAAAPEPTLFGGGALDLPPFTASGIDPQALLQVPWQARHALASAGTPREAYAILNEFSGLGAEAAETVAVTAFGGHPGNAEYAQRVDQWVAEAMDPDTAYDRVFGENEGWGPA